jgi:DNA primase
MIPPKTVQDILDAARIEEVVGEFVTLRRRGINLVGLCPFHGERTPSFNVNPPRNVFKCFGCGKAGDSVTFLREHENLTFEEALRWLGRRYNIEIEEVKRSPEQMAELQLADSLYIVNEFGVKHFAEQLFDTDEGKSVALSYFKQRGLREDTIRAFGLGYAPDQRDLLLKHAQAERHSLDLVQQVGLISQDKTRDFFRARVMFTIHSHTGKVVAFAGRTMSKDKGIPKYVNSPETPVYIKNKTLYGAFQAKTAIRKADECILVEGYMDVLSMYQAGIQNVVASSGTSLTEGQLQLIKRNTQNLTILYDGDPAGIKAALRGLDLALEQDLNVKICLLPDGHDPDSYVQQFGVEAMREYMGREAKDFILFKTNLLLAETAGDPIKKAGLVRDIVQSIALIPDPIKRNVYAQSCAQLMGVEETMLLAETNKLINTTLKKKADKEARAGGAASDSNRDVSEWDGLAEAFPPESGGYGPPNTVKTEQTRPTNQLRDIQERDIVRILIHFGTRELPKNEGSVAAFVLTDIEELVAEFDNELYGRIAAECRDMLAEGRAFDTHYFIHHANPAVQELTMDILATPWEYSPNWEDEKRSMPLQNQPMPDENFNTDMRQAILHFKLRKLMKMCDLNAVRIKKAASEGQDDEVMRLMLVQQKMQEARNMLAQKTNSVILR